jgi:cytoskeletal protein CcmA (bactofilin family)
MHHDHSADDHEPDDSQHDEGADQAIAVDMGRALPPAQSTALPLLQPEPRVDGAANAVLGPSTIVAEGMHFTGQIVLSGPCSVGGEIDGNVKQAERADVAVVVSATGLVKGDIVARRISVMGQTEGLLDAGAGEVTLHDGARVQGKVRYGRIQVNGADLNATLERVAAAKA